MSTRLLTPGCPVITCDMYECQCCHQYCEKHTGWGGGGGFEGYFFCNIFTLFVSVCLVDCLIDCLEIESPVAQAGP